jgi:hypothetical protein
MRPLRPLSRSDPACQLGGKEFRHHPHPLRDEAAARPSLSLNGKKVVVVGDKTGIGLGIG